MKFYRHRHLKSIVRAAEIDSATFDGKRLRLVLATIPLTVVDLHLQRTTLKDIGPGDYFIIATASRRGYPVEELTESTCPRAEFLRQYALIVPSGSTWLDGLVHNFLYSRIILDATWPKKWPWLAQKIQRLRKSDWVLRWRLRSSEQPQDWKEALDEQIWNDP